MPREIFSLWIVGRNGGLLYSRDFASGLPPIDFNDKLRLASSWFGMCGLAAQVSPAPGAGAIAALHADTFDLHSFQALTGTTFMATAEPGTSEAGELLRGPVYEAFCDYVQKNPFHEPDQVIKSELFDAALAAAVGGANRRWAAAG